MIPSLSGVRFRFSSRVALGLLLGAQSVFLASTFRSFYVVVSLFLLAALVVVMRDQLRGRVRSQLSPWPRWLRWSLWSVLFGAITSMVAVWRISRQVGEDINPVYLAVDIVAHAALVLSLVHWVMRSNRGHVAMLPLGLIVVLLSVAAGGASLSLTTQTTVALAACFGFTVGSQIILSSEGGGPGWLADRDESPQRSSWLAPILSLLAMSALMMGTSVIASATNLALPAIQNRLQEQLKASFDAVGDQSLVGGTRYVRGGRLGSIRRHMLGNPKEIALQVHCKVPPGYLRGSVFDVYRSGRWHDSGSLEVRRAWNIQGEVDRSILPAEAGRIVLQHPVKSQLKRFPLIDQSARQTISLEVHNDPMKGPVVFVPLMSHWLEAHAREVVVTQHGIVRIGVDVTRPYVAGAGMTLPSQQLSEKARDLLMDISPSILPLVKRAAEDVCRTASTPTAKAESIRKHFMKEYGYSLAVVEVPRGIDPLAHFLSSRHDAHCEFFASATALMLRSVGVPTRYVTGYVADEPSDEESGMWLARNLDAHAWVEAFDESAGHWFPVESTPGRRYQTVEPDQEQQFDADLADGLSNRGDQDGNSLFASVLGWFSSMRVTDPLLILFRFAQLPLFVVLAIVLWKRYLKTARGEGDSIDLRSRKMLRHVDRKLHRYSLARRPSETLYQFANRVERFASDPSLARRVDAADQLSKAAGWYRSYADARYQGQLPEPLPRR